MSQLFPLVGGKVLKEVGQGKQQFVVINSVIQFYTVLAQSISLESASLEYPNTVAVS